MMLQIMVYATVMTAALSAAGLCLERLATLWRLPRRIAWVVALLFSICWPPLMILSARAHTIATSIPAHSAQPTRIDAEVPIFSGTPRASTATAAIQRPVSPLVSHWNVSALFSDHNLLTAWAVVSLSAVFYLLAAKLRLRRRMAAWRQEVLLDQTVLISERTGPALVGIFRPRLVIPRWLLDEPPATQLLVLEHERQHIAAHDPLLIRAATLLLTAFPWNLPLWWQFRRMRRAIELDCDSRVLHTGVVAQTYGEVLLTVVERATRMPMGSIAMSEPVSALERRIQDLLPDPVRHAVLQAGGAMVVLVLSVGTTFAINAPIVPKRAAVQTTSALPAATTFTAAPTPVMTIEAPPKPAAQPRIPVKAAATPAASTTDSAQPDNSQPDSPRFTVRILPKAPGTGADGEEWNRIEAALAARLRRIPGLTLLTPDAGGEGTADYEMAIKFPEGNSFTIDARPVNAPPVAQPSSGFNTSTLNFFFSRPRDDMQLPSAIDSTVTTMQLRVFPGAAAAKERLLAQLADPVSRPEDRALALVQLLDVTERRSGSVTFSNGPPASEALIRAGVDFASSESDSKRRAGTWGQLRQITAPGIITPVIAALGKETNAEVRLVLISILAWNFNTEPTARAALESIARTDQRQLARMAAQRALTGDAGWNDYVLATLKNTQLTDTQRLEPLTYQDLSGRPPQDQHPLDQEGVRILGTLLERAEVFSDEARSAVNALAFSAASGGVLADLLRVREGRQVLFDVRNRLLSLQAVRPPLDDSRRALIEDIAARDPDARIRETARAVVDSVAKRERAIASLRQRQF